jgi:hypothetical protein
MRSSVLTYLRTFGVEGVTGGNPVAKIYHELNSNGGQRDQKNLDEALKQLALERRLIVVTDKGRIVRIALAKQELRTNKSMEKEQKMSIAVSHDVQEPSQITPEEPEVSERRHKVVGLEAINLALEALQREADASGRLPEDAKPFEIIVMGTSFTEPQAKVLNRDLGQLQMRTTDYVKKSVDPETSRNVAAHYRSTVKMNVLVTQEQYDELRRTDKQRHDDKKKRKDVSDKATKTRPAKPAAVKVANEPILPLIDEREPTPTLSELLEGLVARVKSLETERDTSKTEADKLRAENARLKEDLESYQVADELLEEARGLLELVG